jgi:type IV secretory pathway VirB4 component
VADTGSGKSVALGALTLDARAAGIEAILIDNGRSWAPLTELLGGVHIAVDLSTSISPFLPYASLAGPDGTIANEEIEHAVQFIEVCVADRTRPPFDKVERDVVARAVRWLYETRFRPCPEEPVLIGHISEALAAHEWSHPDDRTIASDLVRRLGIYCTGIYAEFLNRPSRLRFDAPLLTFDLARVSENSSTKAVAMATIIQAITNRAMARRTRTLVEVDEGHEYLGADDATERFLGGCYRKMRKYDTAMWMISQHLNDFLGSRVGREAIVGNSTIRIFLRHLAGKHRAVIDHFGLSPRAAEAFAGLDMKPGWYSDFLLMYGARTTVVRLALHPLAYWVLTTDKEDQDFLVRAAARNPRIDRLTLLTELAARYPHGVVGRGLAGRATAA